MPEQRLAAKALLRDNGRVLFVREPTPNGSRLFLPGGLVRTGEDFTDAIRREVTESFNVSRVLVDDTPVGVYTFTEDSGRVISCVVFETDFTPSEGGETAAEWEWIRVVEIGETEEVFGPVVEFAEKRLSRK